MHPPSYSIRRLLRLAALLTGLTAAPVLADEAIPHIPEPMVFDMVRPLGARAGELEVNALAQANLSGRHRAVEWAPEVELAVTDGFAVELELPMSDLKVEAYKMGLQGTFGTLRGGRTIHGVQYLGVNERGDGRWRSSLLYLLGNRFGERWSTMTMVGFGDMLWTGTAEGGLIVNHSTFFDASDDTVLGLEINRQTGANSYWLLMPQVHHRFERLAIQAGLGAEKVEGDRLRPRAGLRLIREF